MGFVVHNLFPCQEIKITAHTNLIKLTLNINASLDILAKKYKISLERIHRAAAKFVK